MFELSHLTLKFTHHSVDGCSGVSCVVIYPIVSMLHISQSEKLLLFDTVQSELEEKIRRLEEDRHSIDITSGKNKTKKKPSSVKFYSMYLYQDGVYFNCLFSCCCQNYGMMVCSPGRIRRRILSPLAKRRSLSSYQISFIIA